MKKHYNFIRTILPAAAMLLLTIGAAFLYGKDVETVLADDARQVLLFEDDDSRVEPTEESGTETLESEADDGNTETLETETDGGKTEPMESEIEDTETEDTETEPVESESDDTKTEPAETESTITQTESDEEEETEPNVKITIQTPPGWHRDRAKVEVLAEDVRESGKFKIAGVEAKISHSGSFEDITEDMYLEISENCSVYVKVTDQDGKVYQKNRYIECFDKEKPTLNAAIYDGLLNVQAIDNDSGVRAVYVNGYEFTDLVSGVLNIRLQQFDTGYQYYTLQAEDNAGNMSQVYKMTNPYYSDPEKQDSSTGNGETISRLPQNASPTAPADAKGTVTEHTAPDNIVAAGIGGSVKKEPEKSNVQEDEIETYTGKETAGGKEFYTVQTKSGKIFYLIVDKDLNEDNVLLLTEVSENDLLNFTQTVNTQVLPQGTAIEESVLPEETESDIENVLEETEEQEQEVNAKNGKSNVATYILIIVIGLGIGGIYYFRKRMREDTEDYEEEDEEDSRAESDDGSAEEE